MNKIIQNRELEWASNYLDQELDANELADFAEHLSHSPELTQTISDFAQIKRLVKSIPEEKPPRSYVLTRIMASEARKPGILERFFPAFRIAAVICALGLVLTFIIPFAKIQSPAAVPVEYSMKSIDPLILEQSSTIENVKQTESVTGLTEIDQEIQRGSETQTDSLEIRKPSHGFKGGSPKNEFLMVSSRVLPDDHKEEQLNVISDLAAENQEEKINAETVKPIILPFSSEEISRFDAILQIFRFVLVIVLGLSFFWILITIYDRKRTI